LRRSTSINSIFDTHKEKEMADFRKLFYALAIVALLAGLTVPASAQAPFQCTANAGSVPLIRGEGYTELTGDFFLSCSGGTPTAAGQPVPQANFSIFLNTNVTSRLLSLSGWTEGLLIVDEPHTPNPATTAHPIPYSTIPLVNCGSTSSGAGLSAPDTGPAGPGVCEIYSDGNPADTYDPLIASTNPGLGSTSLAGSYGYGRPNVYQAHTGSVSLPSSTSALTWNGVPIDPPGSNATRTFRFTNIRVNATTLIPPTGTFVTTFVTALMSVSGATTMQLINPSVNIAIVARGLTTGATLVSTFLQCTGQNNSSPNFFFGSSAATVTGIAHPVAGSTSLGLPTFQQGGIATPGITFTEGFAASWKARNIAVTLANAATVAGVVQVSQYDGYPSAGASATTLNPTDLNQNVPGALYYTEAGFENGANGAVDPTPNPPPGTDGTLTGTVTAVLNPFNSSTGTGIATAGMANQGTRLALQINTTTLPTGTTTNPFLVLVPEVIPLTSGVSATGTPIVTGVAVLVSTDANGNTAYTPFASPIPAVPASEFASGQTFAVVPSSGLVVYEVLFADPFATESAAVPVVVAYNPSLSSNAPTPNLTTTATASFGPFYTTAAAAAASNTLPEPRFEPELPAQNIFTVVKCACDLLFPYVSSGAGYDTGIAIANTSLDPGPAGNITPGASPQSGTVTLWYYGQGTSAPFPAAPPSQTTSAPIPPGGSLLYVMSSGAGGIIIPGGGTIASSGLDNRAANFSGYIIAQAQFQYCHAFAFIGALGAGPTSPGISEGYLALILDTPSLIRSLSSAESLNN
jgi:hypothetical protein